MLSRPCILALSLLPAQDSSKPYVPRIEATSEEARQALQKFRIAPRHALELFAAEPRLANPVAFHVGFDGVVYVAETFRHHQGVTDIRERMSWLDDDLAAKTVEDRRAMMRKHEGANYDPGYGRAFEQVRRIVDRDGDFSADEDTVFASGFDDHAAGIGAGVLSYGGDVYYTCIPDLWKLSDRDGDGKAEEQRRLSSGYGVHVALLGHDLHGLVVGPDRRLYFSCGDRGFQVETPDGQLAHPQCGAVLRCELDGSHLEVWHTGLRNPQELAFDDQGNLWTGDNNSDGGDRARWVNIVAGGDSGWRYAYQWIEQPIARGPWNDEKLWHPRHEGQAAYLVPPIANLADGPAGLAHYPGTGLSAEYAGHFFLCDFRGDASSSGIHTFTVEPEGAFWKLGPVSPFVWGTLATDCDFGPDGALWFSDWVYGWEQTGKGRLYRAVSTDAAARESARATSALLTAGMGARSADELVRLLAHPDRRVRQEAHFELASRGDIDRLGALVVGGSDTRARLHALWALGIAVRKDGRAQGALLAGCETKEAEVRAQAIRVLGDERRTDAAKMAVRLLSDPSPRVRFFAALTAGRLRASEAVAPLAQLLRDAGTGDPNLRHAAVMGLLGCAGEKELEALAGDPDRNVRMGVVLALRRKWSWRNFQPASTRGGPSASLEALEHAAGFLPRFLVDADPWVVLEAARAIHDVPIEPAMEFLARLPIGSAELAVGERVLVRRVLNANYRLGHAEPLAACAERADLSEDSRVEALDMLAHFDAPSARDRVLNEWRPIVRSGLASGLAALALRLCTSLAEAPEAVLAAQLRLCGEVRALETAPFLASVVADARRASTLKTAALEALEAMGAPNLVEATTTALGDRDGRVRASALTRLARLAPADALARADEIVGAGELAERQAALAILAKSHGAVATAVLKREFTRLEQELVPAELALDLVAACAAQKDPALDAALAARTARRAASDPALAPWLDTLYGGEPASGEAVFNRVDLSCTRCHAWWQDASERVGPNLFGVGQRLTRLQILESIIGPNRRTTPGYGATAFFLKDGRVVAGRVFEESAELVRLFDANNNPIALDPAEIDERRADLSAMPEDLAKMLTPADLRDLLAYLAAL
jgi:quinoprotein glucose dehydrogenase